MWRSTDIPRLWSPKRFGDRGSASGRVEPHAVILRFYESDCLGRSLPSLIAERSRPGQSAPVACGMRRGGVCGSAGQSASAWFSSLELPIPTGRRASTTVARAQTMVLSETRPGAGLTLVRVLRRGLELGECLGPTADWANENCETALRTRVPVLGAVAEGTSPAAARYRR